MTLVHGSLTMTDILVLVRNIIIMKNKYNKFLINFLEGKKGFYLDHSNFFTLILISALIFEIVTVTLLSAIPSKAVIEKEKIGRIKMEVPMPPSLQRMAQSKFSDKIIKKVLTRTKEKGDAEVFRADGVKVTYLFENDIFAVAISKGPFETKKRVVEDWFKSFGLTQTDLCQLKIEFVAAKEVKYPLSATDEIPTGCKVEIKR